MKAKVDIPWGKWRNNVTFTIIFLQFPQEELQSPRCNISLLVWRNSLTGAAARSELYIKRKELSQVCFRCGRSCYSSRLPANFLWPVFNMHDPRLSPSYFWNVSEPLLSGPQCQWRKQVRFVDTNLTVRKILAEIAKKILQLSKLFHDPQKISTISKIIFSF